MTTILLSPTSEYEALVLECSLIKQHQPKYNILLKDDKGYTYLCFSEEPYPRLTVEKNKKKAGTYLGPYMSGYVAREAAERRQTVYFSCLRAANVFRRISKRHAPA